MADVCNGVCTMPLEVIKGDPKKYNNAKVTLLPQSKVEEKVGGRSAQVVVPNPQLRNKAVREAVEELRGNKYSLENNLFRVTQKGDTITVTATPAACVRQVGIFMSAGPENCDGAAQTNTLAKNRGRFYEYGIQIDTDDKGKAVANLIPKESKEESEATAQPKVIR